MIGKIIVSSTDNFWQGKTLYEATFIVEGYSDPIDVTAQGYTAHEGIGKLLALLVPHYTTISVTSIEFV